MESVLLEGYMVTLKEGETLIEEGSKDIDAIYFLLDGVLDIYSKSNYILSLTICF